MAHVSIASEAIAYVRQRLQRQAMQEALDIASQALSAPIASQEANRLQQTRAHVQHLLGRAENAAESLQAIAPFQSKLYHLAAAKEVSLPYEDLAKGNQMDDAAWDTLIASKSLVDGSYPSDIVGYEHDGRTWRSPCESTQIVHSLMATADELPENISKCEYASALSLAAATRSLVGEADVALPLYRTSHQLSDKADDITTELVHANAALGRSQLCIQTNQPEQAEQFANDALQHVEQQLSENSPFVAPILSVFSECYLQQVLRAAAAGRTNDGTAPVYAEGLNHKALKVLGANQKRLDSVSFPRIAAATCARHSGILRVMDSRRERSEGREWLDMAHALAKRADGPPADLLHRLSAPRADPRSPAHEESTATRSKYLPHHSGYIFDVSLMLPLFQPR